MVTIQVENLSKTYSLSNGRETREIPALKNLNFEVFEGDRIGLIGLNGSGKSTLLKILADHIRPTSGAVKLHKNVLSLSHFDSLLHPDLTGIQNIRMQLKVLGISKADRENATNEIIEFSELSEFIHQPVKTYSSGMMLRLSFSMFKVAKPEILLLDEVLSSGDMVFRKKADSLLKDHFRSVPSLILVSHELQEVAKYCNRCIVLEKGNLVFDGSVEDAIDKYLDDNEKQFKANVLPDNELVLHSTTLSKNKKHFLISEEVEVEAHYTKANDSPTDLVVYVRNNYGIVLTDCEIYRADYEKNVQPAGTYTVSFTIPKFLLNVGKYTVDLAFGNGQQDILKAESVVKFEILPDDWEKERLWNQNPTIPVRPHLKWKREFTE